MNEVKLEQETDNRLANDEEYCSGLRKFFIGQIPCIGRPAKEFHTNIKRLLEQYWMLLPEPREA